MNSKSIKNIKAVLFVILFVITLSNIVEAKVKISAPKKTFFVGDLITVKAIGVKEPFRWKAKRGEIRKVSRDGLSCVIKAKAAPEVIAMIQKDRRGVIVIKRIAVKDLRISSKSVKMKVGETKCIHVDTTIRTNDLQISAPRIITAKKRLIQAEFRTVGSLPWRHYDIVITGKKPGKAKVYVTVKGRKFPVNVTVS